MTDAELWASWRLWMGVATVVILIAATLLIIIWRTARGIHTEALRALRAAERIRESTMPIWPSTPRIKWQATFSRRCGTSNQTAARWRPRSHRTLAHTEDHP